MIVRYDILCAGCKAKIRLRISIPIEKKQPFYFYCSTCSATFKGLLTLKEPPDYDINVEDCEYVKDGHDKPHQVITIHPELPSFIDSGEPGDIGWSPFLLQHHLMGANISIYAQRLTAFKGIIYHDWLKFKRWSLYYLNDDWQHFDTQGKEIFDEFPSFDNSLQRRDYYFRILEMFFMHLFVDDFYPKLKRELNYLLIDMYEKNLQESYRFLKSIVISNEFKTWERDIFERMFFVIENFNAISPAYTTFFYTNKVKINDLRIMRDDFDILKSHYVSTFELCHKMLKYLTGFDNILLRNSVDNFVIPQIPFTKKVKISSMKKFMNVPNAFKIQFIENMPVLKEFWQIVFDPKLRNALSHQSIRYDLMNGALRDDKGFTTTYLDFVSNQFSLAVIIIYFMHLTKMVRINYEMMPEPSTKKGGTKKPN